MYQSIFDWRSEENIRSFTGDMTVNIMIGIPFDTTKFSDEYCKYGEFTGTMVGITCADRVKHKHYADFDFLEYVAKEDSPVE